MSERVARSGGLPVAAPWFRRVAVTPRITRIDEPHVDPLLRANVWHVRGSRRDLLVDSGLGVAPLRAAFPDLFAAEPVAILSHSHLDHSGGAHEFDDVWLHPAESVASSPGRSLRASVLAEQLGLTLTPADTPPGDLLLDAVPHAGYSPDDYELRSPRRVLPLRDGATFDLGDETAEVVHLPGHTPGTIAILLRQARVLFTGDSLYDDVLLDDLHDSDRGAYRRSMRRLAGLDIDVVHPGHGDSFGRPRLLELVADYLGQLSRHP